MDFNPKLVIPIVVILVILYFMYQGMIDRKAERVKSKTGSFFSRIVNKYTRGSPY